MQTIAAHAAASDNRTQNVALITYIIKLSGLERSVSQGSSPINLFLFFIRDLVVSLSFGEELEGFML